MIACLDSMRICLELPCTSHMDIVHYRSIHLHLVKWCIQNSPQDRLPHFCPHRSRLRRELAARKDLDRVVGRCGVAYMICDTTFSVRTSRALRQQFRARYGTISFFSLDAIYNCPQCVFVFTFDAASSAMFLFIFYKINDRSDFPIGNLRIMGEFFIKHPVPNFRVVKITYFYQHMLLVFASRKMKFSCLFYHMSGINSSTFFQIYRSCSAPTHRHTNDRAVMRQNKAKNARDKTISVCADLFAICYLPASSQNFSHTNRARDPRKNNFGAAKKSAAPLFAYFKHPSEKISPSSRSLPQEPFQKKCEEVGKRIKFPVPADVLVSKLDPVFDVFEQRRID